MALAGRPPKMKAVKEIGETESVKVDTSIADPEEMGKQIEAAMVDFHAEAKDESLITSKLGLKKMYKIYIHKQANNDNNKPIYVPNHDGGKDWLLTRGMEHIVPDYVVNIMREAIGVNVEYDFEMSAHGPKSTPSIDRVPRFSFDIRQEMTV